jgi:CheY-like chemotaxis protein/signal transduction histidine kinase
MSKISISNQFLLICTLSFASIFCYSFYSVIKEQEIKSNKIISEISSDINSFEKNFETSIRYTSIIAQKISRQIGKNPNDGKYISRILQPFESFCSKELTEMLSLSIFSWVNKQNILTVSSRFGILETPKNLYDTRDYLRKTRSDPGRLYLGEPVLGAISNIFVIPAGIGAVDKNNIYQGSVIFGFDLDSMYQKLLSENSLKNLAVQILYEDTPLVKKSFTPSKEELSAIDYEDEKIQTLKKPSFSDGTILIYKKIHDSPYGILAKFDSAYFSSTTHNYINEILFILLPLLIIVFLLRKYFLTPILLLSREAQEISSGRTDVKISGSNIIEIDYLSKSLSAIQDFIKAEKVLKTELKKSNSDLSKSNLARASILRSITHDIKNYIFGICGLAKIILDSKSKDEISQNKDLQLTENIFSQSEELMHFVIDLLDTNQVESGELSLGRISKCNIKELIERMLLLSQGLAMKHRVFLKSEIEENLPAMECDVRRVKQILNNLITNAIKYSHTESVVKISAKFLEPENQIYFEISDNGLGMTEEEINLLLLGRGREINKEDVNIESYGIGIPIVLQLLKLHDAKIEIESEKNGGTKVKLFFHLVLKSHKKNSTKPTITKVKQPAIKRKETILLVDDNPVNLKVTSTILGNAGYTTYQVENGKEALEMLDQKNFDLILMDGEMPVMNGYEATKKIRDGKCFKNFKDFKTIPIIALMSSSDEETIQKTLESGMNDHLEKTISRTKLLETVASYLA